MILKKGKPKESKKMKQLKDELTKGSATVKFSMNIPRELHREFRKKTFLAEIDMKDVLLDAIRKYLKS